MKCKSSNPITIKGKKQYPNNITTISACESIKHAALLQDDKELILLVANEDLIARELKMHEKCYRDYTRICTKQNATPNRNSASTSSNDENDYCKKKIRKPLSVCKRSHC
jgi:hypothetical protein